MSGDVLLDFEPWFVWGIALAAGFPLVAIGISQWAMYARRRNTAMARVLHLGLNWLLPAFVVYLFLAYVLERPADDFWVRGILTLVLVGGLYVGLGIVNAFLFGANEVKDSARTRTPRLLRELVQVLLVVVGAAIVLATVWKQDVGGVFTALGLGSIVIGLALQQTLGNVMSGIALLMERPFAEGDWVYFGNIEGRVEQINWRAVRLVNRAGDTVVIPHSVAGRDIVINTTRPKPHERNYIELSFSSRHPPNEVKTMIGAALRDTEGVLDDPPASVNTWGYLGESTSYVVVFFVADPTQKFPVRDRFMTRLWYAAQRFGIELPMPVREVRNIEAKSSAEARAEEALRSLGASPLLRGAVEGDEQIGTLSKGTGVNRYADGEVVLHQGSFGTELHLIVRGAASIRRRGARGAARELYRLERGEFFGEISLFSGAASPYAVVAQGDLETLTLGTEVLDQLMANRPGLAREIGKIMDVRRKAVAEVRA